MAALARMGKTFRGHGFPSYIREFTVQYSSYIVFAYAVQCRGQMSA